MQRTTNAIATLNSAAKAGMIVASTAKIAGDWLEAGHYAAYHESILTLIESGNFAELDRLFWERIPFGTGGRRGAMSEFGSATINARTISESAFGVAAYAKHAIGPNGRRVVVAYDTRLRSREFAEMSSRVLAAAGITVFLFDAPRSTPELSFSVRHLTCDAGIMISASHNPPADNGFKAYWSTGCQVLPPHDKGIIDFVYAAEDIPLADFEIAKAAGQIQMVSDTVDRAYIAAVTALSLSQQRNVKALFTPLHGVGETSAFRALQAAGFDQVSVYGPQQTQDGNFPNVPQHLPNPERPQVFEPALATAAERDADLILATDPDADRLAIMVRDHSNEYRFLTGNQLGALLVDYVLAKNHERGQLTAASYVVETMVTTPLIGAISRRYNVKVIDNLLVGFKYIGQTIDVEGPAGFLFGAEESLGYLAGTYARDKDASIAALFAMELAAELKAVGKTLLDRLDELFLYYGVYAESQSSRTCIGPTGQQQIEQIMTAFRQKPPASLGSLALVSVADYQMHEVRALPANTKQADLPSPSGNLLFVEARGEGCAVRVALRPSGTEPKIKFYFFARTDVPAGSNDLAKAKTNAQQHLQLMESHLSKWIDGVLASV